MNYYRTLGAFLVLIIVCLLTGCSSLFPQGSGYQSDPAINALVAANWRNYAVSWEGWGGELSLFIISPKGSYYATTSSNDANAHFRCASVTKTFTAAAIMLLHQQGKLNVDDKITATIPGSTEPYVPNTPEYNIPYKDQISIRMLLRHRAGVWDVDNEVVPATAPVPYAGQSYIYYTELASAEHTYTFDELVSVDATSQLSYFAPDTSFHYSDTGYSLLGKIIERVSGKSYGEFVSENLAAPNGLTRTTFPHLGPDTSLPAPYFTGYGYYNKTLTDATRYNISKHVAEGNAITTPADLASWIKRFLSGQAGLSRATVDLITAEAASGVYGLGVSAVNGLGYGHNGGVDGYVTVARYDQKQDVAVMAFASVINWADNTGEMLMIYDTLRAAKNLLGYSTAEVY
ncbi:MAG: beta-lactamase family protein [Candidatus Margulisbacteria bacterium]|jgi:D-alanyl-D-alanine carboxypeptidase|nr:beta-lactamase family protein [Candidatus Margulisiibacteriota bacterium]